MRCQTIGKLSARSPGRPWKLSNGRLGKSKGPARSGSVKGAISIREETNAGSYSRCQRTDLRPKRRRRSGAPKDGLRHAGLSLFAPGPRRRLAWFIERGTRTPSPSVGAFFIERTHEHRVRARSRDPRCRAPSSRGASYRWFHRPRLKAYEKPRDTPALSATSSAASCATAKGGQTPAQILARRSTGRVVLIVDPKVVHNTSMCLLRTVYGALFSRPHEVALSNSGP